MGRLQRACKGLQRSSCSTPCSINYINGALGPRADCNSEFSHCPPLPGQGHFHVISSHPKLEVTREGAAQRPQRNSDAMSPIQNRRGHGPLRGGLKWGSGLSCFQTAPQNQQPTHLPAQPGKGHLQKSAHLNGLKIDRRSYSSAPPALHPIEYRAPHACLIPNFFLPKCQR